MYMCMHINYYLWVCVCMCIFICMHVCMYVCACACINYVFGVRQTDRQTEGDREGESSENDSVINIRGNRPYTLLPINTNIWCITFQANLTGLATKHVTLSIMI